MSLCYFFLVKKENSNTIQSIQVPCLNLNFTEVALAEIDEVGLESFVREKILLCLQEEIALDNAIRLPKPLAEYENLARGIHDIHSYVFVEIEAKLAKGFFARFFPVLGGASSLASIACHNIFLIVSMQVAAAGLSDQKAINIFSIAESVLASLFNLIVYFNSPANNSLTQFGGDLDNLLRGKKHPQAEKPKKSCCTSTGIILSTFGLGLLAANYIGSGAVTYYQELDGLGEKAKTVDTFVSPDLFTITQGVAVITSSVALLSFYFTFLQNAAGQIDQYFTSRSASKEELAEAKEINDHDGVVEMEADKRTLLSASSVGNSGN